MDMHRDQHRMAPFRAHRTWFWATAVACSLSAATAFAQGPSMGGAGGGPAAMTKPPPKAVRDKTPQYVPTGPQVLITDVRVTGNANVPENRIFSFIKTRSGRAYDPEQVQSDVRSLATSGLFRDVRTFTETTPEGIAITFQVFERPTIGHVKYIGNVLVSDKTLSKQVNLKVGDPLNTYALEEGRRKIEEYYKSQGFPSVEVTVYEGNRPEDTGVTFLVGEGQLERVSSTQFIGNSIASDARLKTFIQSKPGYFWYLGGKVDQHKIDEDVDHLTAYYRSLGFFRARIGREVDVDESGKWVTLKFVIDEGPQYAIRNISFAGNKKYDNDQLSTVLQLKGGERFNAAKLHKDEGKIRDEYGSQGYVFADIKADLRFLEEPGKMDVVYQINEGDVYRVGKIDVKINGESSHTRRTVVLNRLSLRPRRHYRPARSAGQRAPPEGLAVVQERAAVGHRAAAGREAAGIVEDRGTVSQRSQSAERTRRGARAKPGRTAAARRCDVPSRRRSPIWKSTLTLPIATG